MRTALASLLFWSVAAVDATAASEFVRPLSVGFLTLEGVYNSELMAPWDIFHHTVFHEKPGMRVFTVGREPGSVLTFEGLRVGIDYTLEDAPPIDVLVVPSAVNNMDSDLADERLIKWVAKRGASAQHVLSVCDGAFLLAAAGLLDGHFCTTFPGDLAAFRERFPSLNVVEGVSFVADGKAITGAGGARSYDPALYLAEMLYGVDAARGIARGMALDWDREKVRHFALDSAAGRPHSYLPGDRIEPDVVVEDEHGRSIRLADLVARNGDVKAVVFTIAAGAEAKPVAGRGGFWCEDTFSEMAGIRHLKLRYGDRGVLFVGVMCPPVFHEERYGYDAGVFLTRPEDATYERNRKRFVEATLALREAGTLPFDEVVFDPRFRLLGVPTEAGPAWQGRFKWFGDTQTYGTPSIWVLTPDLEVAGPPFVMNVYESPGRKLRYRPDDVATLLECVLAR